MRQHEKERERPMKRGLVLLLCICMAALLLCGCGRVRHPHRRDCLYSAKHLAEVKVGNIEDQEIPFEGAFDYIIFGDVLEHLHDPQGIVRFCREKLTERGCILTSIPNVMHVTVMEQLLKGRFEYQDTGLLDRSHIHFCVILILLY